MMCNRFFFHIVQKNVVSKQKDTPHSTNTFKLKCLQILKHEHPTTPIIYVVIVVIISKSIAYPYTYLVNIFLYWKAIHCAINLEMIWPLYRVLVVSTYWGYRVSLNSLLARNAFFVFCSFKSGKCHWNWLQCIVSIIFYIETCSSLDIVIPKFLPREARSSNKKNRNLKIVKNNSRRTPGSVNAFNAVHSIRTDTTALVCWAIASDSWILYTKSYLPIFPI